MVHRLDAGAPDFEAEFTALLAAPRGPDEDVEATVAAILADVAARGDAAVIEYTERFDRLRLTPETMRVPADELAAAEAACSRDTLDALRLAKSRIEDFHRRQIPADLDYEDGAGTRLGHRWTPVAAAGLYVPGGLAAYPSSLLMGAVPARVAGVARIAMTVPAPDGVLNPLILAAARIAGVDEIYRIGGAQAVAALAYGTETIRPVDKIVGPGNVYVAAAKRQLFGTVGIDLIAGPSEILVVADGGCDADWIAADLLSQAEHDSAAQAILLTDDAEFAERVEKAIEAHLRNLTRADIAGTSWRRHGAIILVPCIADAAAIIDRVAPEHLELACTDADKLASQVRNAGAIFIGRHTPEAVGDYVAGPSHVLPTSRSARFSSGLSVMDFLKRSSVISCSPDGLSRIGPAAMTLARAEGLDAHALSISLRLDRPGKD